MSFYDASSLSNFPLGVVEIERLREAMHIKNRLDRCAFLTSLFAFSLGFSSFYFLGLLDFSNVSGSGIVVISHLVLSGILSFLVSSFIIGYFLPVSIDINGVTYVSRCWDLRYVDLEQEIPSEALDCRRMTDGAKRFYSNIRVQRRPFLSFEARLLYESYNDVRQGKRDVFLEQ